jgi:hypothetical protein
MERRFPLDIITIAQWEQFQAEVLSKPALEGRHIDHQFVAYSRAERRLWIFTRPGHPAHPAVLVLIFADATSGAKAIRQGHYAGNRFEFVKWWQNFDATEAKNLLQPRSETSGTAPNPSWSGRER